MRRRYAFAVALSAAMLVILFWYGADRTKTENHFPANTTTGTLNAGEQSVAYGSNVVFTTNLSQQAKALLAEGDKQRREARQFAVTSAWLSEQNGRVDFWGLVVDQDDHPLPGAVVSLRLRQWTLAATVGGPANFPQYKRTTDMAGHFDLLGAAGDVLTVEDVSLPGYRQMRPNERVRSFSYHGTPQPFAASKSSPVVIRLWKIKGVVPLVHHADRSAPVAVDGSPLRLDFITGRKVASGGHLEVRLVREPAEIQYGRRNAFGWKLVMAVPGGGLQWRTDAFGFEAPADGYLPSLELGQPADDPGWVATSVGEFYFRTEAGQYGRLKYRLPTDFQPAPCGFYYSIDLNPSGSRNLEFEQNLQIDPRTLSASSKPNVASAAPQTVGSPFPLTQPATPPPGFPPPGFPALPPQFTPPTNNPAFPQPPPGFQALTNRGRPFPPPAPPRPPQ